MLSDVGWIRGLCDKEDVVFVISQPTNTASPFPSGSRHALSVLKKEISLINNRPDKAEKMNGMGSRCSKCIVGLQIFLRGLLKKFIICFSWKSYYHWAYFKPFTSDLSCHLEGTQTVAKWFRIYVKLGVLSGFRIKAGLGTNNLLYILASFNCT